MINTRSIVLAAALTCGLAAVSQAAVTLPFSLSGGMGTRSAQSVLSVEAAPSYSWTMNLSGMVANGLTGTVIVPNVALPLYGTNASLLTAAGIYSGGAGNMFSRTFTFTDIGSALPAYTFSVSLDMMADQTIKTTVNVMSLGMFLPGGVIPMNPVPVPVTSVNAIGSSTVTAVPAPGAAALSLAGAALLVRRRRVR